MNQGKSQNSPFNDVNAHDERLHIWALRTAEFALGVCTQHSPIAQREPIGWTKGCAFRHHWGERGKGVNERSLDWDTSHFIALFGNNLSRPSMVVLSILYWSLAPVSLSSFQN